MTSPRRSITAERGRSTGAPGTIAGGRAGSQAYELLRSAGCGSRTARFDLTLSAR